MKWHTAAYELPWFRNCAALREITNNDFRISLLAASSFGLFLNLIIHLCPKTQLLSVFHCRQLPILDFSQLNCSFMSKNPATFRRSLPDSFQFWTFPQLNYPFMSKNPVTFKRSLPDSFLFWIFPDLIVHLCPKSRRIMYGENRRRESI